MNKTIKYYAFILLLFASCKDSYYFPTVANIPQNIQTGDLEISFNKNKHTVEPQISYVINNDFSVSLNAAVPNYNLTDNEYFDYKTIELALGYYEQPNKNSMFSLYSGFGYGNINFNLKSDFGGLFTSQNYYSTDSQIYKFFLQSNLSICSKYFKYTFTPRFTYSFFDDNNQILDFLLYEHINTFEIGHKFIYFYHQNSLSIKLNYSEYGVYPFIFAFGIKIKFSTASKKPYSEDYHNFE